MITITYTATGAKITGLSAERRGCRHLLERVRSYHEWRAAERPNNQAKHMRKQVVDELRKMAEG